MKNLAFALLALTCGLHAAEPRKTASKTGMDPERLARIPARMREFVEKGMIAGTVTLVARHGEVALLEAVGYQDLETKKPMRTDTMFQIRSMTKSVTAVGIMILLEEGRLRLTDPVEKHLPEFRAQMMIDARDGDRVLTTKKPSRPITVRDLMTHTSGMPFRPGDMTKTLAEVVDLSAQRPLDFEPGTKYLYSDAGFGILGRIIEVVTGQRYEKFMEEKILQPLGMKDTFFAPAPPERWDRIASAYVLEEGKLKKWHQDIYRRSHNFGHPAFGIFSTAPDMFAFYQMMLNGGTYNGRWILSRASVEVMTQVHTGELEVPYYLPGLGWGLGWGVVRAPLGTLRLASIGTYGHGGGLGTFGWVDPKKDLVGVFLVHHRWSQRAPREKLAAFMAMAAAAIVD